MMTIGGRRSGQRHPEPKNETAGHMKTEPGAAPDTKTCADESRRGMFDAFRMQRNLPYVPLCYPSS